MYSSVPTSSHSLSKKWKHLIKFYLDLFSMDESKERDLCSIRVDRLGTTIIFLYSFFSMPQLFKYKLQYLNLCTNSHHNISLFSQRLYSSFRLLYETKQRSQHSVKSCFLWSKSAQVSLHDVWFVQYFTHHLHSCYFFLQLEFLILNLNTSVLFHYI
jgi:hypothetical protein